MNRERLSDEQQASSAWRNLAQRKITESSITDFDVIAYNNEILKEMEDGSRDYNFSSVSNINQELTSQK